MVRSLRFLQHVGLSLACLLLLACEAGPQIYRLSGPTMGTTYNLAIVLTAEQAQAGLLAQLATRVESTLAELNRQMSTYDPASEISRFNRSGVGESITISEAISIVLQEAQRLQSFTQGYFDPTVMPLVRLWGFGPEQRDARPDDAAVKTALAMVDINALVWQGNGRQLGKRAPVELDLSAIAKGYGVDLLAQEILNLGVRNYLVEIGGEIRVKGHKPDGAPWRVGVERPEMFGRSPQLVVALRDGAIATSGDYRNYFEEDGQKYSHTIDVRTGYPVKNRLASVSVMANTCMEADALATALMAMGEKSGPAFAQQNGLDVYFLVRVDHGYEEQFSGRFKQFVQP